MWGSIDKKIIAAVLLIIACAALYFAFLLKPDDKKVVIAPPPQLEIQGTVVWYTSLPEDTAEKLGNAFQLYSDNTIKVQVVRSGTFEISDKLLKEIQDGDVNADVFHVADIGIFLKLRKEGHLLEYSSPEYAFYPKGYKDEGFWASMRVIAIGMAYDSTRVKTPPKSWNDLLDIRWKGKIALKNALTSGTAYGEYYLLRKRMGVRFWKNMRKQSPAIYKKYSQMADALLSGEMDIAGEFAAYKAYDYSVKRGTPIRWIRPEEGVPMVPAPVAILKNGKHSQEAKQFIDFLLSVEGQYLTQRLVGTYSVRAGVESLEGKLPLDNLTQLLPESWKRYYEEKEALQAEFKELFELE